MQFLLELRFSDLLCRVLKRSRRFGVVGSAPCGGLIQLAFEFLDRLGHLVFSLAQLVDRRSALLAARRQFPDAALHPPLLLL